MMVLEVVKRHQWNAKKYEEACSYGLCVVCNLEAVVRWIVER
jgi:hypothetical protein